MSEFQTPDFYVHPSAVVDDGALIGEGSRVWHFCHVMPGARIGPDCVIGQNGYIASRAVLGAGCRVQNNVSIYDDVILEDEVFCGPSCVFTNVQRPRAHVERKDEYARTLVRRGASIGANATIVCGVTLGAYCFVGAGATVTRDLPPHALVVGAPARVVGWVCRCGERLPLERELEEGAQAVCGRCGDGYRVKDGCVGLLQG